eukprot:344647_1
MLAHKGVRWITLGWTGFIAENLILSHNREYIIDTFNKETYHGVYNVLSSAACLSIAYGYFRYGRNAGPIINPKYWKPNSLSFRLGAFSCQSLGLIGMSQNFPKLQNPIVAKINSQQPIPLQETDVPLPPTVNTSTDNGNDNINKNKKLHFAAQCPVDWRPKDIPADGVYGTHRITRHPMLFSLGLVGLGIALKTPFATRAIVFGFPLAFALIGGWHQDYRHRRNSGGYLSPEMDSKTSLIPFIALLKGEQNWKDLWNEMKHVNASIGLVTAMYLNASILL